MSTLTPAVPSSVVEARSVESTVEVEQHSIPRTLVLHWVPGLVALFLYLLAGPWVIRLGFPAEFAVPALALPVAVILLQMGYLFYKGKRRNGKFSLEGIVLYHKPMPIWQYGVLVLFVIAWNVVVYMPILEMTGGWLKNALYFWAPSWFMAESDFALYSQNIILAMALVYIPGFTLFGVIEELYFRGFLLPRISRLGVWAPILSTLLFTVYHFDTLQNGVSIFVGFLPIAYLTWRKQNVYLAIIAHAALNLINFVFLFLPLLTK